MTFQDLFEDGSADVFLRDHYLKIPFSSPAHSRALMDLTDWDMVRRIVGSPGVDLVISKEGRPLETDQAPDLEARMRLFGDGHTLTIRHAERHERRLATLAREFESALGAPADIHLSCTPPGQRGFGWHYDLEEVFILQSIGTKEWRIRRNTVNPWPVKEAIPRDMAFERESSAVIGCTLGPGDWLYIPAGWWHRAAAEEASVSLAVGLMAPTGLDALAALQQLLRSSLIWRRRLPPQGTAGGPATDRQGALAGTLLDLVRDLTWSLEDPHLLERLSRTLWSPAPAEAGTDGPAPGQR